MPLCNKHHVWSLAEGLRHKHPYNMIIWSWGFTPAFCRKKRFFPSSAESLGLQLIQRSSGLKQRGSEAGFQLRGQV